MTKEQAIHVLVSFKPAYYKLLELPTYKPTPEDKNHLQIIKVLYDSGLVDDPEVLEAAQLNYDDAAMLVGFAFSEQIQTVAIKSPRR
jgi:hypothetical protein